MQVHRTLVISSLPQSHNQSLACLLHHCHRQVHAAHAPQLQRQVHPELAEVFWAIQRLWRLLLALLQQPQPR